MNSVHLRSIAQPISVPRPRVGSTSSPAAEPVVDSIDVSYRPQAPNQSFGRTLATEAFYWTRRVALTLAAPFASLLGMGLGSSPAGLTGADELHRQGIDGRGTRVAVIDQAFTQFGPGQEDVLGVYQTRDKTFKPGLEKAKYIPGQETATRNKPISTHGNAMSAIITGESRGLRGVAPGAELIGISAIDDKQVLQPELFVEALDWVVQNHKEQNIKAVSASVNYKSPSPEQREKVQQQVNFLKEQGVAVVVVLHLLQIQQQGWPFLLIV